jgi:hypothetical protein
VAIVFCGTSRCALCEAVIRIGEHWIAFPHFLGLDHDLGRYSDSAMHKTCFDAWSERDRFIRLLERAEERPPRLDRDTARRLIEESVPGAFWRDSPRAPTAEELRSHNDEHALIMAHVRAHGAACPNCGARATSFRELMETARARLVCHMCARSCDAAELAL